MELFRLTMEEIAEGLASREFSAREVATAFLSRAKDRGPLTRAYVGLAESEALKAADASDVRRADGKSLSRFDGVPVAVKDNIMVAGERCTAGSNILREYVAPYDATVVARLKASGMIVLGKTNMDEFAMGSSTESSAHGASRNPWDVERVPGGSSGGSAVAVAEHTAPVALGSDTGGSIRQPAAMCGVVGMKPTYGRVSRYGLMAMASSLDQIGPLGKTVGDCAALLSVIEGHDPMDSTSVTASPLPSAVSGAGSTPLKGLRVGVPEEYFGAGLAPGVGATVRAAIEKMRGLGAVIKPVSLPSTAYALAAYYVLMPCEVSANLARYDGVRYGLRVQADTLEATYRASRGKGFGPEVRRRIMLGTYALSSGYYDAYYLQALKVRRLIANDFTRAFADVDVIATPTAPTTAWKLGEKLDDPLAMYLEDACTVPVNVAGLPAISVPCGLDQGMPVGFQLIGAHFSEATLLDAARAFETASGRRDFTA